MRQKAYINVSGAAVNSNKTNGYFEVNAAQYMLWTNDHLEFLTAILTANTEEGLLWTATIILQSYYSRFAI